MQDAQMTVLAGSGAPVTLGQQAVEDVARLALRTASSPKRYATGVPASRRRQFGWSEPLSSSISSNPAR